MYAPAPTRQKPADARTSRFFGVGKFWPTVGLIFADQIPPTLGLPALPRNFDPHE
jgi:hypothetical protein